MSTEQIIKALRDGNKKKIFRYARKGKVQKIVDLVVDNYNEHSADIMAELVSIKWSRKDTNVNLNRYINHITDNDLRDAIDAFIDLDMGEVEYMLYRSAIAALNETSTPYIVDILRNDFDLFTACCCSDDVKAYKKLRQEGDLLPYEWENIIYDYHATRMLIYLIETNQVEKTPEMCMYAGSQGAYLLEKFREMGVPWDHRMYNVEIPYMCKLYAAENGCPMDDNAYEYMKNEVAAGYLYMNRK